VAVLLLFGLITGILWVLWWSFSRERIIIDYCLGRDARASCIIDSQEWRWLPTKSPRWIELARCTPISFLLDDKRYDIVCWKDAPTGIFSIHYAWNALCPFLSDTTKRLMSFSKCRSVKVINNPTKPGSNHREVNCINYKQQ
jgi:hypothetical protein